MQKQTLLFLFVGIVAIVAILLSGGSDTTHKQRYQPTPTFTSSPSSDTPQIVRVNADKPENILYHFEQKNVPSRENLAFVTPWNGKGYDNAVKYSDILHYVSPVWLQVRPSKPEDKTLKKFIIAGTHDIDVAWIKRVGESKIFPRVTIDYPHFSKEELHEFFTPSTQQQLHLTDLAQQVSGICKQNNLRGIVLEYGFVQTKMVLHNFLIPFLQMLKQENLTVILVVAPYRTGPNNQKSDQLINGEQLSVLEPYVHRFMVMTYDYSSSKGIAGPNAPINQMIRRTLGYFLLSNDSPDSKPSVPGASVRADKLSSKILLGLNFYGYRFIAGQHPEAILGDQVLEILTNNENKIQTFYDEGAGEHYFVVNQQATIYYPTARSIMNRLAVMEEWNLAGVGIWEIGQGVQQFFSLLGDTSTRK